MGSKDRPPAGDEPSKIEALKHPVHPDSSSGSTSEAKATKATEEAKATEHGETSKTDESSEHHPDPKVDMP